MENEMKIAKARSRDNFLELKSTNVTGITASLFKKLFDAILIVFTVFLVTCSVVFITRVLPEADNSGEFALLIIVGLLALIFAVVSFVSVVGMAAIQIRNNDYLIDLHDEQKKMNALLGELLNLAREE